MEVWGMQNPKRRRASADDGPDAPQADLSGLTKRPQDSLLTLMLPFRSDAVLRELYLNAAGHLRVGRLLEDFDSFAGQIAYTHCDDMADGDGGEEPLTLVTASLDRIDVVGSIPTDRDLMLRGCVAHVGRSSMSIVVSLSEIPLGLEASEAVAHARGAAGGEDVGDAAALALGEASRVGGVNVPPLVRAAFTFVARDRLDRAAAVPRIEPATAEETALHDVAMRSSAERRAARKADLDVAPPAPAELAMVHRLFSELRELRAAGKGPGPLSQAALSTAAAERPSSAAVLVGSTGIESTVVTFPTDRNIHGKAFGGWLLRNAFELAWAAALRFGGATPEFVAMSDIEFLRPVEIGSVLRFRAQVEYARGEPHRTASVCVETTSMDPREPRAAQPTTNTFHFTFNFPRHAGGGVPRAFPETYEEAMAWVAAHRRREAGMALRQQWAEGGGEPPRV